VLGILVISKVKLKLNMKGKKLQLKMQQRMGAREKMDIPSYEGNLDAEELLRLD
jgi:hypothetical protein